MAIKVQNYIQFIIDWYGLCYKIINLLLFYFCAFDFYIHL